MKFQINLKSEWEKTGLVFIQNAAFISSVNNPGLLPAKLKCDVFRTFFFKFLSINSVHTFSVL